MAAFEVYVLFENLSTVGKYITNLYTADDTATHDLTLPSGSVTYTRARGGLSTMFQNPVMIGAITGVIKNAINGQPPIDIQNIQRRITQPNAKNPLIYLLTGYFLKNKPLMAIGAFQIIDPPVPDDIDTLSDEEIEALSEEIEDEDEENERVCIH